MNKEKKHEVRNFLDYQSRTILLCAIGAVALIIIFVLMFAENSGNKLVIKNNTNLKLEYVKTNFINADDSINNSKTANNIDSHKTSTLTQKTIDLTGTNANLEVRFKFEGKDELFTDAGIFNDKLNGNVKITFTQKDDNTINLTVKASNGLLTSNSIDCNEHYTINLKNGVISE